MSEQRQRNTSGGAMFINERRQTQQQPVYEGNLTVTRDLLKEMVAKAKLGQEVELRFACFERVSERTNRQFWSMSLKMNEPRQQQAPQHAPPQGYAQPPQPAYTPPPQYAPPPQQAPPQPYPQPGYPPQPAYAPPPPPPAPQTGVRPATAVPTPAPGTPLPPPAPDPWAPPGHQAPDPRQTGGDLDDEIPF